MREGGYDLLGEALGVPEGLYCAEEFLRFNDLTCRGQLYIKLGENA